MTTLAEVISILAPGRAPVGTEQVAVTGVCLDSRLAGPGSLFVALSGERADGHDYVASALNAGAVAVLVQRPVDGVALLDLRPGAAIAAGPLTAPVALRVPDTLLALQRLAQARRAAHPALRVVGVTGSVGKTTAKEAIGSVLAERYRTLKSAGNHNNEIGLPLTLMGLEPAHERAVLEMGMYALGEIALLCRIARPQVGVVLNVEPVHLERLGSLERIALAKAELVEALPPDGLAVLHGDDPLVRAMAGRSLAPALTFGLGPGNHVWADGVESLGLEGAYLVVHVAADNPLGLSAGEQPLRTTLLGRHAALPALAAAAVGLADGLTWDEIGRGLVALRHGLRLVPRSGLRGAVLLDDAYNASPSSVVAALDVLTALPGRHLAVLGDMLELGAYEREGHRL
ncbi:MAG: UDP-N-acetylmuramoyl-tripeptide--D-alanyl-D-alanine ligase, partial [Chloroflexota bacterium]